jgi:hypothetical protein
MAESQYTVNGSGSAQPLGFLPALLAFGDIASFKTTLSSEPRAATLGWAIGALHARGQQATAIVLHPTTCCATATEVSRPPTPAGGRSIRPTVRSGSTPQLSLWGVNAYVCADLPTTTGLVLNAAEMDMFLGDGLRIDVSGEAGNRWDQNVTGFRAEEEFGFTAEPYVRTGMGQNVLGL